jgi:hypothetical protein
LIVGYIVQLVLSNLCARGDSIVIRAVYDDSVAPERDIRHVPGLRKELHILSGLNRDITIGFAAEITRPDEHVSFWANIIIAVYPGSDFLL